MSIDEMPDELCAYDSRLWRHVNKGGTRYIKKSISDKRIAELEDFIRSTACEASMRSGHQDCSWCYDRDQLIQESTEDK